VRGFGVRTSGYKQKSQRKKSKEDDGQSKVKSLSYNWSSQKSWQDVVARTARAKRMMANLR
jgi:hypothetical protein